MSPKTAEQALYDDLLSIYARAGAEVTYETDRGETKPYWAKRFLQAVKRAERNGELFEFVSRLIRAEEDSRGFLILKKAGRLDLTVEALVSDPSRPYYRELDFEVVTTAKQRLANHGLDVIKRRDPEATTESSGDGTATTTPEPTGTLVPGAMFDVRVTVGNEGSLSLALI